MRRAALAAVVAASMWVGTPARALQQRWVGEVGCSNSYLIAQSYTNVSTRKILWTAAQSGATLKTWATTSPWGTFDKQFRENGATAVWFPVCIHPLDYSGDLTMQESAAWADFLSFNALLRQRTTVPLWMTPTLGDHPTCTHDDDVLQSYVVNTAVTMGLAQQSKPDIPPASAPAPDQCHFDPIASTNVGNAAVQFLDQ